MSQHQAQNGGLMRVQCSRPHLATRTSGVVPCMRDRSRRPMEVEKATSKANERTCTLQGAVRPLHACACCRQHLPARSSPMGCGRVVPCELLPWCKHQGCKPFIGACMPLQDGRRHACAAHACTGCKERQRRFAKWVRVRPCTGATWRCRTSSATLRTCTLQRSHAGRILPAATATLRSTGQGSANSACPEACTLVFGRP